MNKQYASAEQALSGVLRDGMSIAVGGFGLCGIPELLIDTVRRSGVGDLTIISNNAGTTDHGLGLWLKDGLVRKVIASYVGENAEFERQLLSGQIEVELIPQGTLAEKLRCGGAGIPAFFTPAGIGSEVATGKEQRRFQHAGFDGKPYLLELSLRADLALVRAQQADPWGNLYYHRTARNFNPLVAMAGHITIAEVAEMLPLGALNPDLIHTPSVFVQRVVLNPEPVQHIEKRTVRPK